MPSLVDNMVVSADRVSQLYMTIFAQEFSPCGKYLATANSYGDIAIYELDSVLKSRSNKTHRNKFQGHEDPIFSLTSNEKYLISGSIGQIKGWLWSDIVSGSSINLSWTLSVPVNKAVGSRPEINCMILRGDVLYAAAGDGFIYAWSLENSEFAKSFQPSLFWDPWHKFTLIHLHLIQAL